MTKLRRPRKPPGPDPDHAKRDHYLRLMAQGMNNSAACREVAISRRTGRPQSYGRRPHHGHPQPVGHRHPRRTEHPLRPAHPSATRAAPRTLRRRPHRCLRCAADGATAIADLGPGHRDGPTRRVHRRDRHPGLLLRPGEPMAARLQREHLLACCASTFRKVPTSASTPPTRQMPWPPNSTAGPVESSAGKVRHSGSPNCSTQRHDQTHTSAENGMVGSGRGHAHGGPEGRP